MQDVRVTLRNLAEEAKALHAKERSLKFESVEIVGRLDRWNAAVNLNMSTEQFSRFIGLTPNIYWKRVQAARVTRRFPKAKDLLKAGETQPSHLAMCAAKITAANADLLLDGIKGKPRREVEAFLSCVTMDGRLVEKKPTVEITIKFTTKEVALLDRAREVLSHGGKMPDTSEIIVEALDVLLDKKDPLRKAERSAARQEKIANNPSTPSSPRQETNDDQKVLAAKPFAPSARQKAPAPVRPSIPAHVRHEVWRGDEGQCTWRLHDGSRCPERAMLEIDHVMMWCRGGGHESANLRLLCRNHNQFSASQMLGERFWRHAARPDVYALSPLLFVLSRVSKT